MNRSTIFASLSLVIALAVIPFETLEAQPMMLRIRKEDSHFGFSIYKWGVFKEEGRFRDFDGTIAFDPRNPAATKVEVVINTSSIDSRNEGRDKALRSEEFFNVARYPSMKFKSVGATLKGRDTLLVEGDITIKGVTRRITVPIRIAGVNRVGGELGTLVGFESEFVINREDFNVGDGWSIIDKNARIHLLIGASSPSIAGRSKGTTMNTIWLITLTSLLASLAWAQDRAPFPHAPQNVSSTTTIVSGDEPGERLVITGTVYKSDKKTPFAGLILYLYQTDASGVYNQENGSWQEPRLRGWLKTDENGRYEIRTVKPGSYPGSQNPAHIHAVVRLPGERPRWIDDFLFEDDPYLRDEDIRLAAAAMNFSHVMKVTRGKDKVLQCVRDIVITPR